jgi:hypothetical protein
VRRLLRQRPFPLAEVHRPSFCSSGQAASGLPGEEGAATKSNRTGFGSICLRIFANTEDSVLQPSEQTSY